MTRKTSKEQIAEVISFNKAELIASKRYADKKDLLATLLTDDRKYTVAKVDEIVANYMKGKVI